MIEFHPFRLQDKAVYEQYLFADSEHGCECSFANRYLWGQQEVAMLHGHMVLRSRFDCRSVYPYPLGSGDKRNVLDAIIADADERGKELRITGLDQAATQVLEHYYPGKFRFHSDRDSFDYVYDINDLADLKGKRYQRKRNHYNRFRVLYPDCAAQPISQENLPAVKQMVAEWFEAKQQENPDIDYHFEQTALNKALSSYQELGLEGLVLMNGTDVLAVTLGSRMAEDTFDVHFEKARADAEGAYTAINCEFARYIRDKCPQVRFLNREEDMGLAGLRKSKESYLPHHMVEKYWASLSKNA